MGKLYQSVGKHLRGLFPDEVIVEIGSDRWEGSSAYFADLAKTHGMKFLSVDIDDDVQKRLSGTLDPTCIEFIQADGTTWSANYRGPNIKVLYLDNFDWDWDTNQYSDMIEQQRRWYADRNVVMNNLNSQIAHITQMTNLLPHMSDQCVICVDDTYEHNGVFIGKGGAVVPYLLGQGFAIVEARDYGVILSRNYKNIVV